MFRIGSTGRNDFIGVEKRYDYDSCIDDSTTTKTHFRGWPRGGRAGLERFDKTRIDAGTLRGLPRVTVNGISAPTRHRERLLYLSPSITILTLISTFASSHPLTPFFLSQILFREPHSYFRFFVSRLLTKMTPGFAYCSAPFSCPKEDLRFD